MTDLELGWLAGIIDGEGCISVINSSKEAAVRDGRRTLHYRLFIQVFMCHEEAVRKVHQLTGVGTVTYRNRSMYKTHHDAWMWRVGSRQARGVLEAISPLLVVKRDEAVVAMEFLRLPTTKHCKNGVPEWVQSERVRLAAEIKALKIRNTPPSPLLG